MLNADMRKIWALEAIYKQWPESRFNYNIFTTAKIIYNNSGVEGLLSYCEHNDSDFIVLNF